MFLNLRTIYACVSKLYTRFLGKERKAALEKSRFKQQSLPAWRPNPTLLTTLITFVIFGLIFLTLGILLLEWGKTINEFTINYHDRCHRDKDCIINFTLDRDFSSPVFVYYQVDNLYQNHRRYVGSRGKHTEGIV